MRRLLPLLVLAGLVSCERPEVPKTTEAQPVPTAEPGYAGVPEASPAATPASQPAVPANAAADIVGEVTAPAEVVVDTADAETQKVKAEVLSRIDLMPRLSPEEKDKLYVQVDRARGMGKIITIPFGSGKASIGATEIKGLEQTVKLPQLQKFADDPTVVFVVLGFADSKGNEQKNLAISLDRAESVADALKERCGVMNLIHSVGMGSSSMFDANNLEKNRVVEVWAVLP